ncbi:MAG TPA: NAD(P)/FAD-dependent oxidoreductase [Terriglobales bacterium]|nr:NAD(P)/FAD-dependent oxidoreductase [Terriglobales bacterium]
MTDSKALTTCDVTVLGAGLAGKATALHLAKAGLHVICLEPEESVRKPLGESLDWSAPELLRVLGLPMDDLIARRIATWKKHVTVKMPDGHAAHYDPTPWLAGPPFHIELRTLHVDRMRLDAELLRLALDQGVSVIRDKVIRVDVEGRKVSAVHTAGGGQFSSPWFVDASGFSACILARKFDLGSVEFGPAKVAIWTYFPAPETVEGTTLYMHSAPSEYLDWIWEIPISQEMVSVGYTTTGESVKAKRKQGLSVDQIFHEELERFPHLKELATAGTSEPTNVTSFRCRAYTSAAGLNWMITGEAAAMVDPMTSNGVTAALRHAAEASRLILKHRKRGRLPWLARVCYSSRILQMAKFFNSGIEKIIYETPVRNRIGMGSAGTVYTSPAWSMNVVYARLRPQGVFSTSILNVLLGFFRASAWLFHFLCKSFPQPVEAN